MSILKITDEMKSQKLRIIELKRDILNAITPHVNGKLTFAEVNTALVELLKSNLQNELTQEIAEPESKTIAS